jgi:hypothetical protein
MIDSPEDFRVSAWEWMPSVEFAPHNPITIVRLSQVEGLDLYAVRHSGGVLSIDGKWQYEPQPSSRDDAFMERFRFRTFEEAAAAIRKFVTHPGGRFTALTPPRGTDAS